MRILNHIPEVEEYLMTGELRKPITVELDITNACNHRCPKCSTTMLYTRANADANIDSLSEKQVSKLLSDLTRLGIKSIVFTGGGEPTIMPWFPRIVKAASNFMDVGIKTNGTLIKDEDIPNLLSARWIRISLDAATKETYKKIHGVDEFDKAIEIIEKLSTAKRDTILGVGFLVGKDTAGEIETAVKLVRSLNADYIQLRPFSDWKSDAETEATIDSIKSYYSEPGFQVKVPNTARYKTGIDYNKCHMVHMCPKIGADGTVYACCARRDQEAILGNINNDSFRHIWKQKNVNNLDLSYCLDICRHHDTNREINIAKKILTKKDGMFI